MKNYHLKNFVCVIWLLMLVIDSNGFAQSVKNTENSGSPSLLKTVSGDFLHVFSSPFKMSKKDGLQVLALSAITTLFIAEFDDRIDEEFGSEKDHFALQPADGLAEIGEVYDQVSTPYFFAGLTGAMLTGGFAFKDQKLLETTRLMVESFVITQIFTISLKGFVGRARPYTNRGASDFNLFKFSSSDGFRSMPSGHTSAIFSMMSVIAKQYPQWWVKFPAYTLATSVAFQRMDSRSHWGADVIVGAALGYWVGNSLVNHQNNKPGKFSFHPYLNGATAGLTVQF